MRPFSIQEILQLLKCAVLLLNFFKCAVLLLIFFEMFCLVYPANDSLRYDHCFSSILLCETCIHSPSQSSFSSWQLSRCSASLQETVPRARYEALRQRFDAALSYYRAEAQNLRRLLAASAAAATAASCGQSTAGYSDAAPVLVASRSDFANAEGEE